METKVERCEVVRRDTREVVGFHEIATIIMQGREFTNSGAHVNPDRATAYLKFSPPLASEHVGAVCDVTDWQGNVIGHGRVTARWSTPRSYVSSHMLQVRCRIDGRDYTGRSAGNGMIWNGRRTK